jgi:putative metalloprotease
MVNRRRALAALSGMALLAGSRPGRGAAAAVALAPAEARDLGRRLAAQADEYYYAAADGNPYGQRLATFASRITDDGGLDLNFKVYLVQQANAFGLADGSIRLYSGLMDVMDNDELRYIAGHEIGHVMAGHTRARLERALAALGKPATALAASDLRALLPAAVFAPYTEAEEREADDFALKFLARHKTDGAAAVSALEKLARFHPRRESWATTHPAPGDRAQRLRKLTG